MKNLILLATLVFLALNGFSQTISDVDGNTYNTVTIGSQIWMKENLRTTRYNDSTLIPKVTAASAWGALTTPAYCSYNNTLNADTIKSYGLLYNGYTVGTKKLCPVGWHVPSYDEWTTLFTLLGGEAVAGGKIKETGLEHWKSPNVGADNSYGFSALPAGYRIGANFESFGIAAIWWNSTVIYEGNRYVVYISNLVNNEVWVGRHPVGLYNGLSVRCLCDEKSTVGISDITNENLIYPNPVSTSLNLVNLPLHAEIRILTINGKLIQQYSVATTETTVDVSCLPKGIYLLKVNSKDGSRVEKFIKQ